MTLSEVFQRHSDGNPETTPFSSPTVRPSVAEQYATLARLGLEPQDGVDVAEVSRDPKAGRILKAHPYVAAMHCMARGADGDYTHHPRVTSVDLEHVVGPSSYPDLVHKLAAAAGTTDLLSEVHGGVDEKRDRWVVRFKVGRVTRELHPRRDHDLADLDLLPWLFDAVCAGGVQPAHVRHGQRITVAYVPRWHVDELQRVLGRWAFAA